MQNIFVLGWEKRKSFFSSFSSTSKHEINKKEGDESLQNKGRQKRKIKVKKRKRSRDALRLLIGRIEPMKERLSYYVVGIKMAVFPDCGGPENKTGSVGMLLIRSRLPFMNSFAYRATVPCCEKLKSKFLLVISNSLIFKLFVRFTFH